MGSARHGGQACVVRPRTLEDPVPWRWNPRTRSFELPRPLRLPKRPRRIARKELRGEEPKK